MKTFQEFLDEGMNPPKTEEEKFAVFNKMAAYHANKSKETTGEEEKNAIIIL